MYSELEKHNLKLLPHLPEAYEFNARAPITSWWFIKPGPTKLAVKVEDFSHSILQQPRWAYR